MKNGIIFILAGFLVFGANLDGIAQEKEDRKAEEEKQKQEQMQKQQKIEQERQMKEMQVRKEFLEQEMQQAMKEKDFQMQEFEIHLDELKDHMADLEIEFGDGLMRFPQSPDGQVYVFGEDWLPYTQTSQTQLTLRNSFRGGSDSSNGTFDVDEGTRRFRCMISGKVRSGEIKITIKYPGGKVFKDMTINSSAEVTFSQNLNIGEGDPNKYIGSWEYSVEAVKAEGNYMLQISTN